MVCSGAAGVGKFYAGVIADLVLHNCHSGFLIMIICDISVTAHITSAAPAV